MAQCRLCDKKSFFLTVTSNGLCGPCDRLVQIEVGQRSRIIADCLKLINSSKKLDVRLSRCDILVDHAKFLLGYEQRGIPTINPTPSYILAEYGDKRDSLVLECTTNETEKCLTKISLSASLTTKLSEATKALFKIQENKQLLADPSVLGKLEARVKRVVHEARLGSYIEAAQKAEFKGQKKRALDQYQEALYLLKTDAVDDTLQSENIAKLEAKITELSS